MRDKIFRIGWWQPVDGSWEWHEEIIDIPDGAVSVVFFAEPRSSPARAPGFEPGEPGSTPGGASTIVCDNGCGVVGWMNISPKMLGAPCPLCKEGNAVPGPVAQQDRALPSEGKDPGSSPGGAST